MPTPDADIAALSRFSAQKGRDLDLIQGQGGNSSVKINGQLHVKASGSRLEEAENRNIFAICDLALCKAGFHKNDEHAINNSVIGSEDGLRPSIETSLHAMLPGKIVFHYHCVNTIAASVDGSLKGHKKQALDQLGAAEINYVKPGLPVTAAILETGCQEAPIILLQNHGAVVQAESLEQIETLMNKLGEAINRKAAFNIFNGKRSLAGVGDGWSKYVDDDIIELGRLIENHPDIRNETLYPDHAVILGHGIPSHADLNGGDPGWYISSDGALFVRDDRRVILEPMIESLLRVCARLNLKAPRSTLSEEDVGALLNWDAEKARVKIANERLDDMNNARGK